MQREHIKLVTFWVAKKAQSFLTHPPSPYTHVRDPPHTLYSIPPLSYFLRRFPWAYIFITYGLVQSQFDLEEKLLRSSSHNKIPKSFSSVCWLAQIVAQLQVEAQDIHRWGHRGKRKEACVDVFNQCQLKRCETCAVYPDRSDIVTAWKGIPNSKRARL